MTELCYANNSKSLFRKYAHLVTWFARTGLGSDYLGVPKDTILMLPNGYHRGDGKNNQLTVTTRAIYAPKLYPALQAINSLQTNAQEAKELMLWFLGLRHQPIWASSKLYSSITINPDGDVESTSVDGYVNHQSVGDTFANEVNGAGTAASDNDATDVPCSIIAHNVENQWSSITRGVYLFDASSLPSGFAVIAGSSVFSLYGTAINDNFSQTVQLTTSDPTSNTALANGDYVKAKFGTTLRATGITVAAWNTSGYNDFTLNSDGDDLIVDGICKFGVRMSSDITESAPTWSFNSANVTANFADNGSNEPKLLITYTSGGSFLLNFV